LKVVDEMLKAMCFMILIPLVLVTSISAEVYDDAGKMITEEEIKREMNQVGYKGCGVFGSLFSAGCIGFSSVALYVIIERSIFVVGDAGSLLFFAGGAIVGGYVGYSYWSRFGKWIDRKVAIERVKEKRRTQKQDEDKESLTPESRITLPLLSGSF